MMGMMGMMGCGVCALGLESLERSECAGGAARRTFMTTTLIAQRE
jgi:hypothetical protein